MPSRRARSSRPAVSQGGLLLVTLVGERESAVYFCLVEMKQAAAGYSERQYLPGSCLVKELRKYRTFDHMLTSLFFKP